MKSPNPAVDKHVPLVRTFELSKKPKRRAWADPHVDTTTKEVSFQVHTGIAGTPPKGTVDRRGARCIVSDTPIPFDYIRAEGKAGRMGAQLLAIVTDSSGGRKYYSPNTKHSEMARVAIPDGAPNVALQEQALGFRVQNYGIVNHRDLFTPRQLVAMTTFSDLVMEVRGTIIEDAKKTGRFTSLADQNENENSAITLANALSVYLAFICDKYLMYGTNLVPWYSEEDRPSSIIESERTSNDMGFR